MLGHKQTIIHRQETKFGNLKKVSGWAWVIYKEFVKTRKNELSLKIHRKTEYHVIDSKQGFFERNYFSIRKTPFVLSGSTGPNEVKIYI